MADVTTDTDLRAAVRRDVTGRWAERALHAEAWAVAAMTRVADLEAEVAGLRAGADLHRDIMERLRAEVPDPEGET